MIGFPAKKPGGEHPNNCQLKPNLKLPGPLPPGRNPHPNQPRDCTPLRLFRCSGANVKIIPIRCFSKNHFFLKNRNFLRQFPRKQLHFSGDRPFFEAVFRKTTPFFHENPENHTFFIFRIFQGKKDKISPKCRKSQRVRNPGKRVCGRPFDPANGEFCYFGNNLLLQFDNYFVPLRAISKLQAETLILISK